MYRRFIKRLLDIIISLVAIILLSTLFLIIPILIKILDKGSIFYKQSRTGEKGKEFKIYKFRTMKEGKITKLGRFLRSTSLDEIPQFYNVLKGDMSIVGPRPWIPDYYERFNEKQKNRNIIRPGLVGLAQVNGRKKLNIMDKINYDLTYVEKIGFLEDIKILVKSLKVIISKEEINLKGDYIKKELEELECSNQNK
ncbi:MAG: sugar transferase [Clostridia bacterium]|nr:sugar transferase [Clostridia bacterium]